MGVQKPLNTHFWGNTQKVLHHCFLTQFWVFKTHLIATLWGIHNKSKADDTFSIGFKKPIFYLIKARRKTHYWEKVRNSQCFGTHFIPIALGNTQ